MARNKIQDLRNHLFEAIEKLQEGDGSMDIQTAKTIAHLGSVIVASAKVEVDFIRALGMDSSTSEFIPTEQKQIGSNSN
jgi:hypothetical protein